MSKQVADNTEMQYTTTLKVNENGSYFVETKPRAERGLIREEYIPVGKTLIYPKEWGKTKGSLTLVEHHIQSNKKIIEQSKENIENLERLKQGIEKIGID